MVTMSKPRYNFILVDKLKGLKKKCTSEDTLTNNGISLVRVSQIIQENKHRKVNYGTKDTISYFYINMKCKHKIRYVISIRYAIYTACSRYIVSGLTWSLMYSYKLSDRIGKENLLY